MRVDTLQLVHDGADVFYPVAYFDAHRLFDTHTQSMPVLLRSEIVKTVGQCQCLWVGETFVHLLDTTVYITAVRVDFTDDFPF